MENLHGKEKQTVQIVVDDPLEYAHQILDEHVGYEGFCMLNTFFRFQPDEVLSSVAGRSKRYIVRETALFRMRDDRMRTDLALSMEDINLRLAGLVNSTDREQVSRYLRDKDPRVRKKAEEVLRRKAGS